MDQNGPNMSEVDQIDKHGPKMSKADQMDKKWF